MKIHFIGIGGIGVSALARYYLARGWQVSGSDLVSSEITEALKKLGAKILIGPHVPRNVLGSIDLVIYSPAVPVDNTELKKAKKLGIKCLSYPKALGELTKQYFTIAVSGTHGKSTTTAMIGLLLVKAGFDPTVIIGTKLREFGNSNFRMGGSTFRVVPRLVSRGSAILVIEADEHFASFLNYWPKIIVLTNIEADHLDYYKTLKNILRTFREYISHLPKNGYLICNHDDKNINKILKTRHNIFDTIVSNVLYCSLRQKEVKKLKRILKIPGEHNVSNALAALAVARVLKIPDKVSFKALSEYRGSWRRFEIKYAKLRETERKTMRKITVVSDYGHHPTEIRVTLKAAREKWPKKEIWCVFQPHQYQRTYYLFKDFINVFREALRRAQGKPPVDKLIITDIYDVAGRETPKIKKEVSSKKLVQAINREKQTLHKRQAVACNLCQVEHLSDSKKVERYLKKNLSGGEVVIIMGAGDIYELAVNLTKERKREKIN